MKNKVKEYMPPIEKLPPRPLLNYGTEIRAKKEFPLAHGDVLIVRNGSGRVTERVEITSTPINIDGIAHYNATVTEFDR